MKKIKIGISPCPNDIFIFHAILKNKIDTYDLSFEFEVEDIQTLNQNTIDNKYDCSKVSFPVAFIKEETHRILSSGTAIGDKVGPVVVSNGKTKIENNSKILCPGNLTTAYCLFRYFFPDVIRIENCIFSDIMPALQNNTADFGVVIHEGRFSYDQYGLTKVYDLGELWQSKMICNLLPLGCLIGKKNLGGDYLEKITSVIKRSIEYSYENREEVFFTMSQYAQELTEEAIWAHVKLYVNEHTLELYGESLKAISKLKECYSKY